MRLLAKDLDNKKINNKPFQCLCQDIRQRLPPKNTTDRRDQAERQEKDARPVDQTWCRIKIS